MHAEVNIEQGAAVGELVEQIAAVVWSCLADPACPEPLDESTRTVVQLVVCEELWRVIKAAELPETGATLVPLPSPGEPGGDWSAVLVFRVAEALRPIIRDRRVFEYMADELPEAVAETAELLQVPGLADSWGLEAWSGGASAC